jgi:hypothetical protein
MTDPFSRSNEQKAKDAIREQSKAHDDAIKEATKRRIAARAEQAKRNPNDDVGYRMRPKFYEPGW